jgi:uncharacterized coiled-coil DUF342 family protein
MSGRSQFHPDNMRARLATLNAQRDAILAQTAPLRAQRDAILQEADARARALADQFRTIESGLYAIDAERGDLAKRLGGRSMSEFREER